MRRYVIDAYAWIEYLIGSSFGNKVKQIIEDEKNEIFTNVITVSEVMSITKREGRDHELAFKTLASLSKPYEVDTAFAREAGLLHAEIKKERKHIGLADIFILLTAKKLNAKVVTGDRDFKGLKEVLFLE